ncbi:MAG: putative quinol monooxygenase [Micrococcaceae bacterium]
MILITVKFTVKPDFADGFLDRVADFTEATRAEAGNLWFEWFQSVEDAHVFLLHEAFEDDAAEAHVSSDHFQAGVEAMRPALTRTPQIISRTVEGTGWDRMGELDLGD